MKYIKKVFFERAVEMTDKEIKIYKEYVDKDGVFTDVEIRLDENDKDVKYVIIKLNIREENKHGCVKR